MNALSIPLADNSLDGAMANSMLHLISEPIVVIRDLRRVLKFGGKLMIVGNSPGVPQEVEAELRELNGEYLKRVDAFYDRYWELLREHGLRPIRYRWKYDQHAGCELVFGNHTVVRIDYYERTTETMADYFLYRNSRGRDTELLC